MVPEVNALNFRQMRERFDALSSRVAEAYADVPVEEGMAEIDALVEQERRSKREEPN